MAAAMDNFWITPGTALMTYSRAINSANPHLTSHYFAENIVLDWFGRTVVGRENVLGFLLEEVHLRNHDVVEVKTRHGSTEKMEEIALERVLARFQKDDYDLDDDSGFGSCIYESSDSSFSSDGGLTPCSKLASNFSKLCTEDSLHSSHALSTPMMYRVPRVPTMLKRPSMVLKSLKHEELPKNLKFIDAAGVISGAIVGDGCSPGPVRSWAKHCHLQIGYYHLPPSIEESLRFSILIYNDEMPCRRNLSKIFDQCG